MPGPLSQLPGIIDGALTQALGDGVLPASLIKPGGRVSNGRGGWTDNGSPQEHACRGLLTNYSDFVRNASAGAITIRDRKALIMGASLPAGVVPSEGDKLQIGGASWTILSVARDPAAATYKLHLRPA